MIDLTRILSDNPAMPGRRQQIPRTTSSIDTPACEASYSASMMSGSTSEFIFIQMAAGLPWRAWLVSPRICSRMRLRKVSGDTAILSMSLGSA